MLLLLAGVVTFTAFQLRSSGPAQYYTARVENGEIKQVVEATGTINAVITVQVGSQVSGAISKLYVDFNSHVKKGQLIAQIDPALFQGALSQAQADLENAKANLAVAIANTAKAKASEVQTKADYERNLGLSRQGVVSQQSLDVAKANAESAAAQVSGALAQEQQARAQVHQKQAAVQVAQTNLDYTTIRCRFVASAYPIHHRPGPHEDAGLCQDRRIGRGTNPYSGRHGKERPGVRAWPDRGGEFV